MSFSHDGVLLASAYADGTIQLWNAKTLSKLMLFGGHSRAVSSLAWSLDAVWLASASFDRTVKIWSADGQLRATLRGHSDAVLSVAWGLDSCLASSSDDGTIQLHGPSWLWLLAELRVVRKRWGILYRTGRAPQAHLVRAQLLHAALVKEKKQIALIDAALDKARRIDHDAKAKAADSWAAFEEQARAVKKRERELTRAALKLSVPGVGEGEELVTLAMADDVTLSSQLREAAVELQQHADSTHQQYVSVKTDLATAQSVADAQRYGDRRQ